jgi:hypothetical protein
MFYDGLGIEDSSGRRNPTIRYKNYPTELADEAMQGYNLDIAIYETVRKDEPRVDGNLHGRNDFTAHFAYENYTPPPIPAVVNETLDVDSEEDHSGNGGQKDDVIITTGSKDDGAKKVRFSLKH